MGLIKGTNPRTLQEEVDLPACQERLAELGEQRSLPALQERVWLLKVTGDTNAALALAKQTVRTARMVGTRQDLLRTRILEATVQQANGDYATADHNYTVCAEEATGQRWYAIAAFAMQNRGRSHLEQSMFNEARTDFKQTLFLRQQSGASETELEKCLIAIATVDRRQSEHDSGDIDAGDFTFLAP